MADSNPDLIDIKVETPLKASVLLTLGNLIDAAWPGSQLAANDDRFRDQVIFRIDNSRAQHVDAADAAGLRMEPDDMDLDITRLGPEGISTLTPEMIAAAFLPAMKAAFEMNPSAENYLEFTLHDREDHHRYLLTFCKSAQQTPHELRMRAEKELEDVRRAIHAEYSSAIYALLAKPRNGRGDTYEDGVKAALDAVRQLGFAHAGDDGGDD